MVDGRLELIGTPINIIPTSILCDSQKMLIQTLGFEKAYNNLYSESKKGSLEYNKGFIAKRGLTDKRKTLDLQIKIVSFAGWGEVEVALENLQSSKMFAHFKSSPYPTVYGKANYAVDFVATGFIAGGVSATMGEDLDAVETKCVAMGDPFCEIHVGKPDDMEKLKKDLWKKWGVI